MCLMDIEDNQSRTRTRRRLAAMVILLVSVSFLIGWLHPQAGADADFFDFLRGLTVGVALALSFFTLALCRRGVR
jgi:hypothetical protein